MDGRLASGFVCPTCQHDDLAEILSLMKDGTPSVLRCRVCRSLFTVDFPTHR